MTKASDQTAVRERSIKRGLDFLYRLANTPHGFDSYGSFLICCFALLGATSRDAGLRQLARSRAQRLAHQWRRVNPFLPPDADRDRTLNFILVRYALSRIGLRDPALNAQLRIATNRFSAQDLLGFNPATEPPANDLPHKCECGLHNQRGRTFCKQCRRRLEIQSRYRVWMDALASTYVSERCGVVFGAPYEEVLKWLPALRPYPVATDKNIEVLRDAVYAVTHIIYTLNDYGTYRLSPRWLPREFAFLKANVTSACERDDAELLGELLDSLRAFGLRGNHPLVKHGTQYLLAKQNKDGSWGDLDEENIRARCHTTWTAMDGLRSFAWRGERLSRPEVKSMLKRWAL